MNEEESLRKSPAGEERPGTVVGRWVGTRRVMVEFASGKQAAVESSTSRSDDVTPGDSVLVALSADGDPVDWRPAGPPDSASAAA